jgi:hypothetical protein
LADQATRTVERALALLASVCDRGGANLADTARDCELAPSTALRLLRTLETTGFVRKDDLGLYRPGSRIIQLGAQALSDESLIDLAAPAMEELATETGESVYLSVEGHAATAVYISIVEGTHSVRHASWVGRTVPLDTSAAGHALRGKVSDDGFVVVERGVDRRHRDCQSGVLPGQDSRGDEPGRPELSAHRPPGDEVRPDVDRGLGRRLSPFEQFHVTTKKDLT